MATGPRARRTPLALAVLSLLNEAPRHPYEMQSLIRERHVGEVVRLRGGSLYDAIARLEKLGLVEKTGTTREGARPERTVYAVTERGRAELFSLLREYLGERAEEFPVFLAGLAHLGHLPFDEVMALLRTRAGELTELIEAKDAQLREAVKIAPRLVLLEAEYAQAMRRAELGWLRGILADAETGRLEPIELTGGEQDDG